MGTERVVYACGCIQSEAWCSGDDVTYTLPSPCEGCARFERAKARVFATHAELFRQLAESEREDDRERLLPEVWD